MQPKVSMVIPCYNKENEIGNMFDSIIMQIWDNIELILVNDGSTDKTLDIIAEYELKFQQRGYSVIIVDQENKGLPLAVYIGLKHISGDFVCQVDADDELDSMYVSTMAGWLETHNDYDWVVCDSVYITPKGVSVEKTYPNGIENDTIIEKHFFIKIAATIHQYMVRVIYLHSCNVLNYYLKREGSQEAPFLYPLITHGGKLKYFEMPLYKYLYLELNNHHSQVMKQQDNSKKIVEYVNNWFIPVNSTINALPVSKGKKDKLSLMAEFARIGRILKQLDTMQNSTEGCEHKSMFQSMLSEYLSLFKQHFNINSSTFEITNKMLTEKGHVNCFVEAVEDNMLYVDPHINVPKFTGSIIAWGVLGQNGQKYFSFLKDTIIEPDKLWDFSGDGYKVQKPDIDALTSDDLVLIFPSISSVTDEIKTIIRSKNCKFMMYEDIVTFIKKIKYPMLYNGDVFFTIK